MAACRWVGETHHCDELGVGAVWGVALRPVPVCCAIPTCLFDLRPPSPQVPRPSSSRAQGPRREYLDTVNKKGTLILGVQDKSRSRKGLACVTGRRCWRHGSLVLARRRAKGQLLQFSQNHLWRDLQCAGRSLQTLCPRPLPAHGPHLIILSTPQQMYSACCI
jgi:hypothetical protein